MSYSKNLGFFMIATMAVLTLAGCGGGGASNDDSSQLVVMLLK